ncbi:GAF domain-containing sensor histidine kinase [Asanoa sp. NPDC050611]|uniref:GAF domain-containing sensor histidine kinase n=1 Tax=Asanoa sp. NPDC050611 TaxID=3157098 RepID=UPI0033E91BFD
MDAREELRALSAAVLAVTARRSVREVLQTIVSSARRLLNARYAALGVPDADSGAFAEFVVDGVSDAQWRAIGPLPRQHGLLAVMLRDPAPLRLADIRSHPRFEYWPKHHPELRDFLGMPITHGDEILGALYLANKRGGEFDRDDEDLLRILAGHAAIALINARLYERSRELSVLEERDRIARELHDSVAQKLFSLRLTADAAAALVARDPDRAAAQLGVVRGLAGEASDELRAIVVGMRPADLVSEGLDAALRKQVRLLDRVHAARVSLRVREPVPRVAPHREDAAYRVAQEALHNALRHADARTVEVRLFVDGALVIEVCDDGTGLRPTDQASLGLTSMRERAASAGGRLVVSTGPGKGTTVRVEVPVD